MMVSPHREINENAILGILLSSGKDVCLHVIKWKKIIKKYHIMINNDKIPI